MRPMTDQSNVRSLAGGASTVDRSSPAGRVAEMFGSTVKVMCVVIAMAAVPAAAQDRQPAPSAPTGQEGRATPAPVAGQDKTETIQCDTDLKSDWSGGASVVDPPNPSIQRKAWQPAGGEIVFTLRSFHPIPPEAEIMVCFRWMTNKGDPEARFHPTRPDRLDLSSDGKTLKVTTRVPDLWPDKDTPRVYITGARLVPLADVRILALGPKQPVGTARFFASALTTIGITSLWVAGAFTLVAVGIGFLLLYIVTRIRLKGGPAANAYLPLRLITTPGGYASLSQLQIVLWTFIVGAAAVYVMSLSGELVEITTGTLVLLGISGTAVVGSKWHSEAQDAAKQQAQATSQASGPIPPPITPPPTAPAATPRDPMWSDLFINETRVLNAAGNPVLGANGLPIVRREIDVTRVQMLYFTLISGSFVIVQVLTTYVIPEIPQGFVTLMGISNGVYMGSKIVQNS
jgi:hypothetical protein